MILAIFGAAQVLGRPSRRGNRGGISPARVIRRGMERGSFSRRGRRSRRKTGRWPALISRTDAGRKTARRTSSLLPSLHRAAVKRGMLHLTSSLLPSLHRAAAGCLSAFLLFSCTAGEQMPVLSVMSWNVQNLFDGVSDGNEYREFNPALSEWNSRLYQRRLERTGQVIAECGALTAGGTFGRGPDVVVLQEIEKAEILDDLALGVLKRGGYKWRVCVPGYGIVRCGVLSRYPVDNVQVRDCGTYGEHSLRPVLLFTVHSPAGALRMAAVHWKSPWNGLEATESARCQEARQLLLALRADNNKGDRGQDSLPLLLLGDFNTPGSGMFYPSALAPWQSGADPESAVIFRSSSPQNAGERSGCTVFFDPEPEADPEQPFEVSGTYWYKGKWQRPDRALMNAFLVDGEGLEFLVCRSGGAACMQNKSGHPIPWRTRREEGYSDHLPLILFFVRESS